MRASERELFGVRGTEGELTGVSMNEGELSGRRGSEANRHVSEKNDRGVIEGNWRGGVRKRGWSHVLIWVILQCGGRLVL